MKRIVHQTTLSLGVFLLLGVATVYAQDPLSSTLRLKVPFEFHVETAVLPAGQYLIRQYSSAVLQIQNRETANAVFAMALPAANGPAKDYSRLLFKRYGDQYFLSEVWESGQSQGRQLNKSLAEQEAAKNMASVGTIVEVALGKQ
jgi:hypothetical protein